MTAGCEDSNCHIKRRDGTGLSRSLDFIIAVSMASAVAQAHIGSGALPQPQKAIFVFYSKYMAQKHSTK